MIVVGSIKSSFSYEHTLDYIHLFVEKVNMITNSTYVCRHMHDTCLGQYQTHLW